MLSDADDLAGTRTFVLRVPAVMRAVLVLLCGCSSFIHPVPPHWDHASDPRCTETYDYVVGDLGIAGAAAGGAYLAVTRIVDRTTAGEVGLGALVVGLAFAISAGAGYGEVDDCQRALEAWRVAHAVSQLPAKRLAPGS